MRSRYRRLEGDLSYRVFLMVYILSYLHALPHADLVIDMDELGEPSAGEAVASAIEARCGLALDFSDCSLPTRQHFGRPGFQAHQR